MRIVNLLHFYQPHNQQEDILNRIVNESYRPIIKGLLERPDARIVINIAGVLTKLLSDKNYLDVINDLRKLHERGQIELTASAMYHAVLPLLPESEIKRQIKQNEEINRNFFGESYQPVGFFPPELAIDEKVLKIVPELGYQWIAVPQVAYGPETSVPDYIFKDNKTEIKVFFRNKRVSVLILSATVRSVEDLIKETQDLHKSNKYWFTVMDAETFGHHRIGHEKLLFEILDSPFFQSVTVSDLLRMDLSVEEAAIRPSTWTNQEQDFWLDKEQTRATTAKSFILWQDPKNPIHKLQWELTELAISKATDLRGENSPNWREAREKLDKAIASDQYWWASAKPWWSLEMIEQGAYALRDVLFTLEKEGVAAQKAEELYRKILDQAFEWQRSGYVRQKHLEASGTYMKQPLKERAPAEWYNQIVLEMEQEINDAAEKQDFERAIKWRDALIKLKQGMDIYDVLHVVDDFWLARNLPWGATKVKPFFAHKWEEFSEFAKQYFREYDTEEKFEDAQKSSSYQIEK